MREWNLGFSLASGFRVSESNFLTKWYDEALPSSKKLGNLQLQLQLHKILKFEIISKGKGNSHIRDDVKPFDDARYLESACGFSG